jgi:leucyl aminopeptidase
LSENDLKFLQAICESIRTCSKQVDSPANIFHTEAFAKEAEELVDELNAGITKTIIKVGFII